MPIEFITGDITQQRVDAIINSANPTLLAGSGLSGAIHKAAGCNLEQECLGIGRINIGSAVLTGGYSLPASFVIHVAAPRWRDGNTREPELLEECYFNIFSIVKKHEFRSIAIPAIGIGIYRWPIELAAQTAIRASKEYEAGHTDTLIRFVCFTEDISEQYRQCFLQR